MLYTSLYNYNQEEFFICKIILLVIIIANSISRILAISSHFRRCLSTSPTSAVMPVYVDFERLCQYISCSHDQTRLARITRLVKLQNSHSLLCLVWQYQGKFISDFRENTFSSSNYFQTVRCYIKYFSSSIFINIPKNNIIESSF